MLIDKVRREHRLFRAYGCTMLSDIDLGLPELVNGTPRTADVLLGQAGSAYDAAWEPEPSAVISRHHDAALGQSYVSARTARPAIGLDFTGIVSST